MEKVGLTELKNNLSAYIAKAAKGAQFLITEHDKPVAKLSPLTEQNATSLEEKISALVRSGKVQCDKPLQKLDPPYTIEIEGISASDLLIQMRD